MYGTTFVTAWGWVAAATGPNGLSLLVLPCPGEKEALEILRKKAGLEELVPDSCGFGDFPQRLKAYFSGQKISFAEDRLDWSGTSSFRQEVFTAVKEIPYGEVRTYKWVAQRINRPRAFRAVGQALKFNPLPVVVPCHRVVGHSGGLGGYSEGPALKVRLLSMEGLWTRVDRNPVVVHPESWG